MTVKKKSLTPPAPDAGAEGTTAPEASTEASGATAAAAPPAGTEERIKEQAAKALDKATGDQAVRLSKAEARANGLEGELKKSREALTVAEQNVKELTLALAAATTAAKNAGTAIAGLPDNARQLNESVTVAVLGRGGTTPRRAQLKATDVVLLTRNDDEVDALQRELGLQAVVYKVSKDTLDDLEQLGHLHARA